MSKFDIYSINQGDFFTQTRTVFLYGEINATVAFKKALDEVQSELTLSNIREIKKIIAGNS